MTPLSNNNLELIKIKTTNDSIAQKETSSLTSIPVPSLPHPGDFSWSRLGTIPIEKLCLQQNLLAPHLQRTIRTCHVLAAEFLIEKKADFSTRSLDKENICAIDSSTLTPSISSVIELLFTNAIDLNRPIIDPDSSIYNGKTPLVCAIIDHKLLIASTLISMGADVNACVKNTTALEAVIYTKAPLEFFKQLIYTHQATLNLKDVYAGWSPLMYAIHSNSLEIAKFLITNNADINHQSDSNDTALTILLDQPIWTPSHQKIFKLLVNKGAQLRFLDHTQTRSIKLAEAFDKINSNFMINLPNLHRLSKYQNP